MMNNNVKIVVDGLPVAKGRARVTRQGFAYTPAHTRKYEDYFRFAASQVMGDRPPLDGPLKVTCLAVMPVPVSFSRRKKADAMAGSIKPTGRPDLDNLWKAAADACNSIVWTDDARITTTVARKRYGDNPRFEIVVQTDDGDDP